MRKKLKMMVFALMAVLMLGSLPAAAGRVNAASTSQSQAKSSKKQYGWFKKGLYTYYRKANGKLYKNTVKKIDNYNCRFDEKGRLVRKWNQKNWYDSTLTKHKWVSTRLTITEKGKDFILLKTKNKNKFMIYNDELSLIYGKNNKKIKFSKLKEGQKVEVVHDGFYLETYPAAFSQILKLKVL